MSIIRYTRAEHANGMVTTQKEFSETPFPESVSDCFTDSIHITLPDGFFMCSHERAVPGYRVNSKTNGTYFHWCVNGKGTYNGIPFKKNDVFVVYRGTQKTMISDVNEPWEIYLCVWKGSIADTAAAKLSNYGDNTVYSLENSPDLSSLFDYLVYQPHRERRISKVINAFTDVLISDCHIVQKKPHSHIKDARAKTIVEIQNYINANYLDTSVEKIAARFHYNRKYITRIFHEYTGMTMCEYIREAKLRAAERYLLTTSLSIEEVAFHAGYSNYSSFIKAFKKKNGITPTEFSSLYIDS